MRSGLDGTILNVLVVSVSGNLIAASKARQTFAGIGSLRLKKRYLRLRAKGTTDLDTRSI